jgi:hypothetical protein
MRDRECEAVLGSLAGARLEPGSRFVREGDDDHLVGGELAQSILDSLKRIRVTDMRLHVLGRRRPTSADTPAKSSPLWPPP